MEFLLMARDGTDEGAAARRLAARERHLALFDDFSRRGHFKYGCAILSDDQRMIGSVIHCEFSSRQELEDRWLSQEPYVLGDVWKEIEVLRVRSRVPQA